MAGDRRIPADTTELSVIRRLTGAGHFWPTCSETTPRNRGDPRAYTLWFAAKTRTCGRGPRQHGEPGLGGID